MWEYWIEDPVKKVILVYNMEHDAAHAIYSLSKSLPPVSTCEQICRSSP